MKFETVGDTIVKVVKGRCPEACTSLDIALGQMRSCAFMYNFPICESCKLKLEECRYVVLDNKEVDNIDNIIREMKAERTEELPDVEIPVTILEPTDSEVTTKELKQEVEQILEDHREGKTKDVTPKVMSGWF